MARHAPPATPIEVKVGPHTFVVPDNNVGLVPNVGIIVLRALAGGRRPAGRRGPTASRHHVRS